MSFIYSLEAIWDDVSEIFNGISLNIDNGGGGTPVYAAGSYLMKLSNNDTNVFTVNPVGAVAAIGSNTAVAPALGANALFELCNTSNSFQSGGQLWFSAVAGNPYATISGALITGPSPYTGEVVFAIKATTSGALVRRLSLKPGGLLESAGASTPNFTFSDQGNIAAYNSVGAECFTGYTDTLATTGGDTTTPFYGVADNNQVGGTIVGVMGGYFEGRVGNSFLSWGAEIDTCNYSGLDPNIPTPWTWQSPSPGPLNVAIVSQPAGSLDLPLLQKDSSAWAVVTTGWPPSAPTQFIKFRRGLLFTDKAIGADASGNIEMLSAPNNYQIAWYSSSTVAGRLSCTDGIGDLLWIGDAATLRPFDTRSFGALGRGGAILFYGYNSVTSGIGYAGINAASTTATSGAEVGDLVFKTMRASVLTEGMRLTGAGNLGIGAGATVPGYRLEVHAAADNNSGILVTTNSAWTTGLDVSVFLGDSSHFIRGVYSSSDLWSSYFGQQFLNNSGTIMTVGYNAGPNVGIGRATPVNLLDINGSFGRNPPVTKTGDFSLAANENWIINNRAATNTVTLPAASSWTGREVMMSTIQAQTVVSASANVVPLVGGAAATAILAATAGKWATLVSDGTNWVIMQGN